MMSPQEFQKTVYSYYYRYKRILPWRWESDPYRILVSEVMLQQTQVSRVIPKYHQWLAQFPTFQSLAEASLRDVIIVWQGMGYNRRAKYLHEAAKMIIMDKRYFFLLTKIPRSLAEPDPALRDKESKTQISKDSNRQNNHQVLDEVALLQELPGIGQATASAIIAYAFNMPVVFLETNIRAVYLFHYFKNKQNVTDKELLEYIKNTLDYANTRDWYYALTDYGAMLKKKEKFQNIQSKHYLKQSKFEGSRRQLRGRILKILLTKGSLSFEQIKKELPEDERIESVISELEKEGLIIKDDQQYKIV
ncbi:A/G-specific adenine glycosylase [Candidatus Roizmanbacteria bacterium]|nr:A/G-specific adenine glycosylase [Candidatus Roizmanbacteria bacterium]